MHKLFYISLAALFPLIFTCIWLMTNSQLPMADATDYLTTGYNIYRHFSENGFWHGLQDFHIPRGWRPIYFPVFTLPFLLISKGDISFAFQSVAILCVMVSAIYVYRLSRLLLERWSAIIVSNLIVLLPFTQMQVLTFFAESALFPAVIGSIYHLIQSDFFRHRKHRWGFIICFTLAILIRPVEAATELVFITGVFLFAGWHKKIFSFRQVLTVITMGLATVFIFLFSVSSYILRHYADTLIDGGKFDIKLADSVYLASSIIMKVGLVAVAALMFTRKSEGDKQKHQPPIIFVFFMIFAAVLIWFLPKAFQTYNWIFRTSMGDLAIITSKVSVLSQFQSFVFQESFVIVIGVLLTALISAFLIGKKKLQDVLLSFPVIYLLLLIPFPLWEVLNTVQYSSRKLHLAFPALIFVLLLFALQRGKLFGFRFAMIAGLLLVQFLFAMNFYFTLPEPMRQYAQWFGIYPYPVNVHPNPHDLVLDLLNAEANQRQLKHIAVMVDTNTGFPVDPFYFSMMYQIKNLPYTMDSPFFSNNDESNIHVLRNQHDAAFLTGKKDEMKISAQASKAYYHLYQNEIIPPMKVLYQFLYYYSANKLNEIGWKSGPCMMIKSVGGEDYQGCLLFAMEKTITPGK